MKKEEYKAPSMDAIEISPYDNYCGLVINPGSDSGGGSGSGSGGGSGSGRDEGFVA